MKPLILTAAVLALILPTAAEAHKRSCASERALVAGLEQRFDEHKSIDSKLAGSAQLAVIRCERQHNHR